MPTSTRSTSLPATRANATSSFKDRTRLWSPDGQRLAFIREHRARHQRRRLATCTWSAEALAGVRRPGDRPRRRRLVGRRLRAAKLTAERRPYTGSMGYRTCHPTHDWMHAFCAGGNRSREWIAGRETARRNSGRAPNSAPSSKYNTSREPGSESYRMQRDCDSRSSPDGVVGASRSSQSRNRRSRVAVNQSLKRFTWKQRREHRLGHRWTACNAIHTSGCGQTAATVTVGNNPLGVAIDQATNTIYVANSGANTVSVINGATFNRTNTSGATRTRQQEGWRQSVSPGRRPGHRHDLRRKLDDGTISVINGATCNGGNSSVGSVPPTVTVSSFPTELQSTKRLNGLRCERERHHRLGNRRIALQWHRQLRLGQTPPTVDVGGNPVELAVDQATNDRLRPDLLQRRPELRCDDRHRHLQRQPQLRCSQPAR